MFGSDVGPRRRDRKRQTIPGQVLRRGQIRLLSLPASHPAAYKPLGLWAGVAGAGTGVLPDYFPGYLVLSA